MDSSAALAGILASFGIGFFIIFFAFAILSIIIYWKVYEKAGEPGWACLIPIYGTIVFLRIGGKPWYWLLGFFVPILGIILIVKWLHSISLAFGKDTGFTVGLFFLTPIFLAILAFGDAKYIGPDGAAGESDPEVLDQGV